MVSVVLCIHFIAPRDRGGTLHFILRSILRSLFALLVPQQSKVFCFFITGLCMGFTCSNVDII